MNIHDVNFYIGFIPDRIRDACYHEAQRLKLDQEFIHKEAIQEARRKEDSYNDQYGTSGFVKWFSVIVHQTCTYWLNNPTKYREKLYKLPIVNGSKETYVDITQPVVIERSEPSIKIKEKVCSQCELTKPVSEFYKNRNTKDGCSSACKQCLNKKKPNNKSEEKQQISMSNPSEFAFTDQDVNDLVEITNGKLIKAKEAEQAAKAEVERLETLIIKLERRRKNHHVGTV